jgi:hypothetical protein
MQEQLNLIATGPERKVFDEQPFAYLFVSPTKDKALSLSLSLFFFSSCFDDNRQTISKANETRAMKSK